MLILEKGFSVNGFDEVLNTVYEVCVLESIN